MKVRNTIITGLIAASVLSTHIETSSFGIYLPKEFILILCCLLLLAVSLCIFCAEIIFLKVTISDFIAFILYIFFIANTFIFHHQFQNIEYFIFISILFLVYIIYRISNHISGGVNQNLLIVISPLIIEFIFSSLQYLEVIPSLNPFFSITGSFNNPSILAAFAAMCSPIALHFFLTHSEDRTQRKIYVFSGIILLISIVLLVNTGSRGAMISAILSCAYILAIHFPIVSVTRNMRYLKLFVLSVAIPLISGLIYYLYSLRPDSSLGRLFIWKNTLQIIAKGPMLGIGPGNFSAEYSLSQEQYFRFHKPSPQELAIVDSVLVPFNEILGLVAEEGIIGAALFILFIIYSWKNLRASGRKMFFVQCVQASFLSIFVFSMTSYPSKVLAIQVPILLLFADINSVENCEKKTIKKQGYAGISIIILFISLFIWLNFSYFFRTLRTYHTALAYSYLHQYRKANYNYAKAYLSLRYSGDFLMNYACSLNNYGQYTLSNELLSHYKLISYSYEYNMLKAKNYFALSEFQSAIICLKKASQTIPSRFEPLHLLLLSYEKTYQYKDALKTSYIILSMPIKKPSEQIQKIREKAKNITIYVNRRTKI